MYGYELPGYIKDYEHQWRRYDRFLRVRRSLDEPGRFVLERKTRYLYERPFDRGTDRQVQLKDGYRQIVMFEPRDAPSIAAWLRSRDVQALGGAKELAYQLQEQDELERRRRDRVLHDEFEDLSSEAYDHLAWVEGRRVGT